MDLYHLMPVNEEDKKTKGSAFGVAIVVLLLFSAVSFGAFKLGGSSFTTKPSPLPIVANDLSPETLGVQDESPNEPEVTPDVITANTEKDLKTITLLPQTQAEGYIKKEIAVSNQEIVIGTPDGEIARGFLSFDLANIPNNATVASATLKMYMKKAGGDYESSLPILFDSLNIGATLDKSDLYYPARAVAFAKISQVNEGILEVDVSEPLQFDLLNGTGVSQYRIRMNTENKNNPSVVTFSSYDIKQAGSQAPELVIEYYLSTN